MAVLLVGALIALALLTAPEAPPPLAEAVVLLPGPDGRVGTVIVNRGANRTVLNQPYAATRALGARETQSGRLSEETVRSEFGDVLAALPPRPASFLLYFIAGLDELTPTSKVELERLFDELRRRPLADIVVIGHTDRVGGENANDVLSLQRAERVKADLIGQGIAVGRIRAAGRGEREPLVPTADGMEEPRNRRVEISVR